ncbi:MAG: RNA polymerase sigma factor [Trebonia sp.]|jgi:RNA polymerase sigma-70 factor (ECF subfamily)
MTAGRQASPDGLAGPDAGRLDDASVIRLSLAEPERFETLFQRHAPVIQRYVVRRLGADAADDIVAETFLLAFRQRADYDTDRGNVLPWLYGIATNLLGRHRRDEIRQYKALARSGTDPVTAPFTDQVDERVTAAAASRRLAEALAGLKPAYRDALLLVAWGGLSYEETAGALGIPPGTVRSRISRARADLRRTLGDLAPDSAAPNSAAPNSAASTSPEETG